MRCGAPSSVRSYVTRDMTINCSSKLKVMYTQNNASSDLGILINLSITLVFCCSRERIWREIKTLLKWKITNWFIEIICNYHWIQKNLGQRKMYAQQIRWRELRFKAYSFVIWMWWSWVIRCGKIISKLYFLCRRNYKC